MQSLVGTNIIIIVLLYIRYFYNKFYNEYDIFIIIKIVTR